jgi:DNA-binding Lrp family transcriptional regulator
VTQRHFKFEGQFLTLSQIGKRTGMSAATLSYRIHTKGMSLEQALASARHQHHEGRPPRLYLFRGKALSIADIADMTGLSISAVYRRRFGDRILERGELKDPNASYQDAPSHARLLTFRGRTNTIAGWAKERGIHKETLRHRLLRGWPVKYALTIPPHVGGFDTITHDGKTMTIGAWAKEVGLSPYTLRARLDRYGWDVARALSVKPPQTYTYEGRTLTLGQWATLKGMNVGTLRERVVCMKWPLERALTEPVNNTFAPKSKSTPPSKKKTGGSSKTFMKAKGTGGGSVQTDFEGASA